MLELSFLRIFHCDHSIFLHKLIKRTNTSLSSYLIILTNSVTVSSKTVNNVRQPKSCSGDPELDKPQNKTRRSAVVGVNELA